MGTGERFGISIWSYDIKKEEFTLETNRYPRVSPRYRIIWIKSQP